MKKRLLALALALLLCLTLLPATAFAEEAPAEGSAQGEGGDLDGHDHELPGGEGGGDEGGGDEAAPSSNFEAASFNAYTVTAEGTAVAVPERNVSPTLQTVSLSSASLTAAATNSTGGGTAINYNNATGGGSYNATPVIVVDTNTTGGGSYNATPAINYTNATGGGSSEPQKIYEGPTLLSTTFERVTGDTLRLISLFESNSGVGRYWDAFVFVGNHNASTVDTMNTYSAENPNGWIWIDTLDLEYTPDIFHATDSPNRYIYNRTGIPVLTNPDGSQLIYSVAFTETAVITNATGGKTWLESGPGNVLVVTVPEPGQSVTVNATGGGTNGTTGDTLIDLTNAKLTGVDHNKIYTEAELAGIGLQGLTKGVDYTTSVHTKDFDDGTSIWIIDFLPVSGRSKGATSVDVFKAKPCTHPTTTQAYDNEKHWDECDTCHAHLNEEEHAKNRCCNGSQHWDACRFCNWTSEYTNHSVFTVFNDDQHWAACYDCSWTGAREDHDVYYAHDGVQHWGECRGCAWDSEKEDHALIDQAPVNGLIHAECVCGYYEERLVADIGSADVTGANDLAKLYVQEELEKLLGLEQNGEKLVEDRDYTKEITTRVEDNGDETWVIKFTSIPPAVGEQTVELKKSKNDPTCEHADEYHGNDSFHWFWCSKCGRLTTPESHSYQPHVVTAANCTTDAVIEMRCVCDHVDPNGRTAPVDGDPAEYFAHHVWGTEYQSDSTDHWLVCTVCSTPGDKHPHELTNIRPFIEPSCIEHGVIQADCSVCSKTDFLLQAAIQSEVETFPVLQEYRALGHDFSGPVTHNSGPRVCTSEGQGNHAPTCTRCGIHDTDHIAPHSWTGIHNVSNGNCADPDDPVIQEATCSECDATLHIEKPREHVLVEDKSQDVQATCTEPGQINGHRCMICGQFLQFETVEALGHDWVEDDRKEATCEEDGYIHYTCSRCQEEKTEVLECRTKDRKHHWVLNVDQAPTCLGSGTYDGDICTVCGAKTNDFHGAGIIDELGHQVTSVITKIGRVRNKVSTSGTPMEISCYRIDYVCTRCKARLGVEYYTVAVATASVIGHGSFQIEPGKDVSITEMKNGVHVNGNMAQDGGAYFDGTVLQGLNEAVELGGKKYQYKKVPANSFIIEFSDWFLQEVADGEHTLEIINGDEYWPMILVIEDHKIVEIKPIEETETDEMSEAEFEAWLKEAADAGVEVKELGLGCPDRENG